MHESVLILLQHFGEITIKETTIQKWEDKYLVQYPWKGCDDFDNVNEAVDAFLHYLG